MKKKGKLSWIQSFFLLVAVVIYTVVEGIVEFVNSLWETFGVFLFVFPVLIVVLIIFLRKWGRIE